MKTPGLVLLLLWAGLHVVAGESKGLQDHTVPREMRALVAELQQELKHTKTQMEAMETRLKQMDTMETRLKQMDTMETRLKQMDTMETRLKQMDSMETRLKQMDSMETRLKQMDTMETRLKANEKQMEAYAMTLNLREASVETLRRERETRMVSFSTSLAVTAQEDLGPYPTAVPLIFKHVITNIGNAYSPHTGIFTAPVRGVYHFLVFAVGFGHASRYTAVYLQKNGQQVVIASGRQPTGRVDTSNAASLLLEVGDVVSVNLYPQAWVHDSHNHHTTFSGHLLFPM